MGTNKIMNQVIKEKYNYFREKIEEYIDSSIKVVYPEKIYEAMRYSLLSGGKRLRPVILMETASLFNVPLDEVLPSACAVEMLHCQSLIHDDLPCMDNDDYRRGKLSNHKVYGEAVATLAGDALLSYAPKLIIDNTPDTVNKEIIVKILKEFFIAAGVDGIISGQVVDMESENKKISLETLNYLQEYKTAKLFKCAIRIGGILGCASEHILNVLTEFAGLYGHAFQIYDDILDVTSSLETLGKTPGKDEKSGKSTYVTMLGLEEAKKHALFICSQACDILKTNNIDSEILRGIVTDISEGINECL